MIWSIKEAVAEASEDGPATDREVMRLLGFEDKGAVSPRITEMLDPKDGRLAEVGSRFDSWTGKTVRLVAAAFSTY